MATKKKTTKSTKSKKKTIEEKLEIIEENVEKVEKKLELEKAITDKKQAIKEDLQKQLMAQGKYGKHFDDMIEDYLYLVELKEKLKADINDKGIRYKTTGGNGFTTYKPNESCERILKTNAEMLKILQDLDLKSPDEIDNGDGEDDLL